MRRRPCRTLRFSGATLAVRPLQPVVTPRVDDEPTAYTGLKSVLGDSFASRAATI